MSEVFVKYGDDQDLARMVKASPPGPVTTLVPVSDRVRQAIRKGELTFSDAISQGLMKNKS